MICVYRWHVLFTLGIILSHTCLQAAERNIIVFVTDDESPTLGCYGDTAAVTPAVDALAKDGALKKISGNCEPCRIRRMGSLECIRLDWFGLWHKFHRLLVSTHPRRLLIKDAAETREVWIW